MPFFHLFPRELETALDQLADYAGKSDERIAVLVDLTQRIYNAVEREPRLAGFWESIPARNKLRTELQKILLAPQYSKVPKLMAHREQIISRVMELAESKHDTIAYAE